MSRLISTALMMENADGKLAEDGNEPCAWDAENRLIGVSPGKDAADLAAGDKKVEFVYAYLGRRVEKKVYTHDGSSWSVTDCRRFVHHNWLPLLEYEVSNPGGPNEAMTIVRKYTWGLDLGGDFQTAPTVPSKTAHATPNPA